MISLLLSTALATDAYDPTVEDARFTGVETWTVDEEIRLWGAIERHVDPEAALFAAEDFNDALAWPDDSSYAPWIAACFGTATPSSDTFLLHLAPSSALARGTPILFVPGAGDNASRGFITMATRMDQADRPVFALTFAHPHGDVLQQAEVVADAIARVRHLTGAEQIDVVSHSKGGVATAVYLSNHDEAAWDHPAYEAHGTRYRSDVRRAVFIATPLDGIDTSHRWPLGNYASVDAETAVSPTSWETWYPYGVTSWWLFEDLGDQDLFPEGRDLFPGHRQMIRRQAPDLPGSLPWLGAYALQPDWWTTYEGGTGVTSEAAGIDAVEAAGGYLLDHLEANGVDPAVELTLLAGTSPLMPNGAESYLLAFFDKVWVDVMTGGIDLWAAMAGELASGAFEHVGLSDADVQGLAAGKLVLGEITGPSDGLVFVDSATRAATLTGRGAEVQETYTPELSHLDLLYASPLIGELLLEEAAQDPVEHGWLEGLANRYIEADTLGWLEAVLADPETSEPGDTGGPTDTGSDTGGDTWQDHEPGTVEDPPEEEVVEGCGWAGCTEGSGLALVWLPLVGWGRRRR